MSVTILSIGSVLWDVIGRAPQEMRPGMDVAGEIQRLPGGVALNIAMTAARFGLQPILLSAVGQDRPGEELLRECEEMGLVTDHVFRSLNHPTDRYMAIEGPNGVIAAIADARSLEAVGDAILAPLRDGTLATMDAPYDGVAAVDGNLTEALLNEVAHGPLLARADLRIAPASPGKATRLLPFLSAGRGTLYVNCEEAGILCGMEFDTSQAAAEGLIERGAARAIVTHGQNMACDMTRDESVSARPADVEVQRLTGAGDTLMAAHIAAEVRGADRRAALHEALKAAGDFVSGAVS